MTGTQSLAPPAAVGGAFFLGPDTNFRITAFNSAASVVLTIAGQVYDVDGRVYPFAHTHVPNTDRSVSSQVLPMGTGWILNAEIVASSGTPRRGQCFARLELVQGREGAVTSLGTLLQGYVSDTNVLAYPGTPITQSTEGHGVIRSITGTDPAAGSEISETVPTNARWRLMALRALLVTSATVATRVPVFTIDDGVNTYWTSPSLLTQAASLTQRYHLSAGFGTPASTAAHAHSPAPTDLILMGGHRILTITTAFDAGDNWGAPQMLVEEWIED
jgi:hypothetical protein